MLNPYGVSFEDARTLVEEYTIDHIQELVKGLEKNRHRKAIELKLELADVLDHHYMARHKKTASQHTRWKRTSVEELRQLDIEDDEITVWEKLRGQSRRTRTVWEKLRGR